MDASNRKVQTCTARIAISASVSKLQQRTKILFGGWSGPPAAAIVEHEHRFAEHLGKPLRSATFPREASIMHIRYFIYALPLAVLLVLAWRDPRVHGDFLSAFVPVATAIAVVEIVF